MMPYYYNDHMTGGWGVFALLLWLVLFVDLILLGIWLWQRISKK